MANSPHRFGAGRGHDERALHVRPWSVAMVDKIGPDPLSAYVEDFWLGVLGHAQPARSQPGRGLSMTALALEFSAEEIVEVVAVASQPGGEILSSYRTADEPNGELLVACRNWRASRCLSCTETSRVDTCHHIRAGLGCVAKYAATKRARNTSTLDRPVVCWRCEGTLRDPESHSAGATSHVGSTRHDNVRRLGVSHHAQAVIRACWTLGGPPEREGLWRRAWAQMLRFRGHFTKTVRRYSTTVRYPCQARRDWGNQRLLDALGYPKGTPVDRHHEHYQGDEDDDGTILALGRWQYRRRRHSPKGIDARAIATISPSPDGVLGRSLTKRGGDHGPQERRAASGIPQRTCRPKR